MMGLCGVWLSEIENIGLLCIKVPYFWGKSTDVLPREVRCFFVFRSGRMEWTGPDGPVPEETERPETGLLQTVLRPVTEGAVATVRDVRNCCSLTHKMRQW